MDTLLQVAASWILPALFFWFLFSLFAMTSIEFIQRELKLRQKGLEEAIEKLLGKELTIEFYKHALVNPLEDAKPSYISQSLFAKVVMGWMLKKSEGETPEKKDTVNISAPSLYKVILDWMLRKSDSVKPDDKKTLNKTIQENIKELAQINAELGVVLQTIATQVETKTEKTTEFLDLFQKDLEAWFLASVRHMSSVYGARLQSLTLGVSLAIAALANFDVISITVRLWETSKYGELLALFEKTGQTLTIDPKLITMLPVGWYANDIPSTLVEWVLKFTGLYLGAFFIAIGSQYIYNLFKKQYQPKE